MGIFDKAKDLLAEHGDKVDSGIDKAAEFVDQKTGGQHHEKIAGATGQVKGKLDEFAGPPPVAPDADPLAHQEPLAQPDPAQPAPAQPAPPQAAPTRPAPDGRI